MSGKWLTLGNAADYLGVSKDFIRDMISDGLPCYKLRSMIFVRSDEIDKLLNKSKI